MPQCLDWNLDRRSWCGGLRVTGLRLQIQVGSGRQKRAEKMFLVVTSGKSGETAAILIGSTLTPPHFQLQLVPSLYLLILKRDL